MTEPAPEPLPDDLAVQYADALLACLCAQLELSIAGPACACCLRHGGHIVTMDNCSCSCDGTKQGQASVQITNVYPSRKFPQQGLDAWDNPCRSGTWVAELTMTVYRCVSVLTEGGQPPTCVQLDGDARKIQSDRAAMMRAFACCDWRGEPVDGEYARILPGAWIPVAAQGGCAGGFMTVLIDLGPYCCSPVTP